MSSYSIISNVDTALATIPPDSIVSRTVYQGETLRIVLFGFAAGQELSEHTSTKEVVLHLLRGEATVTLGSEETLTAHPGTIIRMAPNLPHSVHATVDTWLLLHMFGR